MSPRQLREPRSYVIRVSIRAQKKAEHQESGKSISKGKQREEQAALNT